MINADIFYRITEEETNPEPKAETMSRQDDATDARRKLVCIMPGLYRSESGDVRISREHWWKASANVKPWVARWTSFFGAKVEARFDTFREVKHAYENNTLHNC